MLKGGKPLEIMITHKELEALNPCEKGLIFTRQYTTLQEAWNNCHRSEWMWWFLQKFNRCPKKLSIQYSQLCADHVSHLRDSKNDAAAYAYATDAAKSAYAADADAAVDAFTTAHTADAAAYATAYAAKSAYAAERKWQADQLRILVPAL
jgi:hypothetical protein